MRKATRNRQQAGDTIVEVLIAIAVVSSVLAIAYSTMNRNLQIMRNNQERTQAVRVAQDQIETLKARQRTGEPLIDGDGTETDGIYDISVVVSGETYAVTVQWDALTGIRSQVMLVYRLE